MRRTPPGRARRRRRRGPQTVRSLRRLPLAGAFLPVPPVPLAPPVPPTLRLPRCRLPKVFPPLPPTRCPVPALCWWKTTIAAALLESLGMTVECAFDGQEALAMLEAAEPGHFAVVLMDIQMPVMNGLEATRCIRASERADLRDLPVVVLSANAFAEDVLESKRAGADDHLSKPISIKDLAATLRGILG